MPTQPVLCTNDDQFRESRGAVDQFVAELQAGIDHADAEAYNADVAVAHVRRVALDGDDVSAFSEMALYVLVHRDGQWWLAAGQNTIIRPKP